MPFVGQNLRTEQIAVMLFSLLKKDAEQVLAASRSPRPSSPSPPTRKGLARHATKLCAGAAGMQVLTLINEPTAAAICYGLNAQDDQTVLVYDFGGGTLDVTILRIHHGIFEEISSKGIGKLGGDDIDAALGKHHRRPLPARRPASTSSTRPTSSSSCSPSRRPRSTCPAEHVAVARKAELVPERHLSLEEEIDRGTFERVIMPLVVKSGTAIDEALKLRGLRPKDIDRVLLVGGTSKIPLIKRYVTEKLAGKEPEPFDRVDPMTCVAQGAAIVSAILQGAAGPGQLRLQRQARAFAVRQPGRSAHQPRLPRPDRQARRRHPLLVQQDVLPRRRPGRPRRHQRLRGRHLRQPRQPRERQARRDPLGVQAAAAAEGRRPGSRLRVRRRRHPDGA